MKITKDQANTIRTMALQEASNAQIAEATGLPLSEIYAYRSRNNITRKKVRQLLGLGSRKSVKKSAHNMLPDLDPALAAIIKKCGGNLERVVKYILSATEQEAVCELCSHKTSEDCVGLVDCAAAVAAYLQECDGHA